MHATKEYIASHAAANYVAIVFLCKKKTYYTNVSEIKKLKNVTCEYDRLNG